MIRVATTEELDQLAELIAEKVRAISLATVPAVVFDLLQNGSHWRVPLHVSDPRAEVHMEFSIEGKQLRVAIVVNGGIWRHEMRFAAAP
jgi:hypothetical protein